MSQTKQKTQYSEHARTHSLPRLIWFVTKSSMMAYARFASNMKRMFCMPFIDAQDCRASGTKPHHGTMISSSKAHASLTLLILCASTKEPELITMVLWNLWNRKNNLSLGKPTLPLNKVLEYSREQWFESPSSPSMATIPRSKQPATWSPPPKHQYKVKFNGAMFAGENTTGLGVVARNSDGLVMVSLAQKIPLPSSVIEVKVEQQEGHSSQLSNWALIASYSKKTLKLCTRL